jgi:hypothetical protein
MKSNRLNYYITNFNVVNIIIGYALCVSLLVPFFGTQSGASQLITVPYRAISLLLSLFVVLINIKSRVKLTYPVLAFFLFWIVVLIRMFYDLEIRTDVFVLPNYKTKVWLIAIAGCFIPMYSLFKSIKTIDFDYCLKIIYRCCIIILIPSLLFSISSLDANTRDTGNIALDAISFGSVGITLSLLSLFKILNTKSKNKIKLLYIIFGLLGFYIALKSASRGPFLGFLIIVIFLYVIVKRKGLFAFSIFIFIVYLFKSFLINALSVFTPFMAQRLSQGISGGDMSLLARQESYIWFIEQILEHPFLGSQFARLGNGHYPGYAHSIILDILLGFGLVGLTVCIFFMYKAFRNFVISVRIKKNYWVGIIMAQYFLLSLTSGAYYSNPILNCMVMLTLLLSVKNINYKLKN